MADVFGRQDQILMGGLSSDSMFMTWPELTATGGGLGMLIQQLALDYRQPIRRIFEIGPGVVPVGNSFVSGEVCDTGAADQTLCQARSQPTYYIVGRPEGKMQMGRFVGPQLLGQCFYRKYGAPCSSNVITLSGQAGCSSSSAAARRMTWLLHGVVVDGLNMNMTGQEMVIQEGVTAMLTGLNIAIEGVDAFC